MEKTRENLKFRPLVTMKMKECYQSIITPYIPVFSRTELPIIILQQLSNLLTEYSPSKENMEGGIFSSAAGVGFTLLRLASFTLFEPIKDYLLFTAKGYADACMDYSARCDLPPSSLLFGKAGLYAMCAVVYKSLELNNEALECVHLFQGQGTSCMAVKYSPEGGEDLCDGRAGFIAAGLLLRKHFKKLFTSAYFYQYLELMVENCREHSKKNHAIEKLAYCHNDIQNIGMLQGFGGVLLIILCFPSYLDEHPELDEEVRLAVDHILLRQMSSGDFYITMGVDDSSRDNLLKWSTGGSGLIHLFAKAYMRWNFSRYYYSCILVGDRIWKYGIKFMYDDDRKGGIGLDHGLTGNLYGLLVLYRLTHFPIYLEMAHICTVKFKDINFTSSKSSQGLIKAELFSLFQGLAGAIYYLMDLLDVENAEFPFLPVFHSFNE